MATNQTKQETTLYNVQCMNCGSVWQPLHRTRLWWRAKQREKDGYLDAAGATGEECGCIKRVERPNATYRVFGYDGMGYDYDMPFSTFTGAIKTFLTAQRQGDVVFIQGVSPGVEQRLTLRF